MAAAAAAVLFADVKTLKIKTETQQQQDHMLLQCLVGLYSFLTATKKFLLFTLKHSSAPEFPELKNLQAICTSPWKPTSSSSFEAKQEQQVKR